MYRVLSSGEFSMDVAEIEDAIALADLLASEEAVAVCVFDLSTMQCVYRTRC